MSIFNQKNLFRQRVSKTDDQLVTVTEKENTSTDNACPARDV